MTRAVEALDGLSVLGAGHFGAIGLRTPEVLWDRHAPTRPPEGVRPVVCEAETASAPGKRALGLRQASNTLRLEYTIPAPEVAGRPGWVEPAGPGAFLLHGPLAEAQLDELARLHPELLILGNARALFAEGEPFLSTLASIRARIGAEPLLWAPRVALPNRLAFLAYVSVDLVDSVAGLWAATEGTYLDATVGARTASSVGRENGCRCIGCADRADPDLARHATEEYATEMARVRAAIRDGRLRELVEVRQGSEPALAEDLRYADRTLGLLLESRAPVLGRGVREYTLRDSFRRPEVARYRRRFVERYRPPPSKRILLLVPCSKTKPYRNSRSHRRIGGAVSDLAGFEQVHVVSVTSPLGVVPRELEDLPPARHYDIPVTGEWDEAERTAVVEGIRQLRSLASYDATIVHLDRAEYAFLNDTLPTADHPWTLVGSSSTATPSLAELRRVLEMALARLPERRGSALEVVKEELAALAAMQFGTDAAAKLFRPPVRLHGRPWFQRVTDGAGTDLATWQESRGLFQLTVAGALRMGSVPALEVEVDPGVQLMGDLFAPGVRGAGDSIRIGDAVLLTANEVLLGVGEAVLPAPLMTQLKRGLAVRVRHRTRVATASTDR